MYYWLVENYRLASTNDTLASSSSLVSGTRSPGYGFDTAESRIK